jgi:uncharacterized protein
VSNENDDEHKDSIKYSNKYLRWLLIIVGTISVFLGLLGIILPLLPTTPFLLLAAASFARSSDKFYNWLLNNRIFGSYIRNYREGKGIPIKVKITAIIFLWSTILITALIFVPILAVKILLIAIAMGVTIHILKLSSLK